MSNFRDDNHIEHAHPTDAHGQAAMLLVESVIHGLIAKALITVTDAVEIVDTATDVSRSVADEIGHESPATRRSVVLLEAIGRSLGRDIPAS